MTWGADVPARSDLVSLQLLGTVGEPINPEVVDVVPRARRRGRGAGRRHLVAVRDRGGRRRTAAGCRRRSSPAPRPVRCRAWMPRWSTTPAARSSPGRAAGSSSGSPGRAWPARSGANPERYRDAYWRQFAVQGYYFAGDGARYDADGYIWLLGRLDDVVNVSGHRLSTIEIESALVAHPDVGEAGVAGVADELTGQAVAAFVIPSRRAVLDDAAGHAALEQALRAAGRHGDRAGRQAEARRGRAATCPRPAAARSCGGCSATCSRGGRRATRRRWPTSAPSTPSARASPPAQRAPPDHIPPRDDRGGSRQTRGASFLDRRGEGETST